MKSKDSGSSVEVTTGGVGDERPSESLVVGYFHHFIEITDPLVIWRIHIGVLTIMDFKS